MASITATQEAGAAVRAPPEPQPAIQDHALIGDLHTAALVANDGSIDFLCLPDFDSGSCFASLLGTPDSGRWNIAPVRPLTSVNRRYRGNTLILETEQAAETGAVRLIDFMPIRRGAPRVVRIIEGLHGHVTLNFEMHPRFAYGFTLPRESSRGGTSAAIAGPDALYLRGGRRGAPPFDGEVTVHAGERAAYELAWARPYHDVPPPLDIEAALRETEAFWNQWTSRLRLPNFCPELVMRSLITLKALTYRPNGAIVAAPTFGLPEAPGGERNWDYRYTWVRDSVLALQALMLAGLESEAEHFGEWLANAIGGAPGQFQIMYGIRGERILAELELPWLAGHRDARPVRIGNAAYSQFQLDVVGEFAGVLLTFASMKGRFGEIEREAMRSAAEAIAEVWQRDDHGIWEMRGPTRAFTTSKLSAWVTIDHWLKLIGQFDLDEDPHPWEALRDRIRDEILEKGYDPKRNTFTQYYGSSNVDATLLFIPMSGFLPVSDPRVVGTVKAIEDELIEDGLVLRYRTDASDDGLTGKEGVFLACSFWLASVYHMMGRRDDARRQFERAASVANDVGLLAEEYLTNEKQQTGNFPQAFSHFALVNAAYQLGYP
ncbi:MAG TPA: glycoside hydrolase family 15 protein [Kofleriaceae bacterium]